MDFVVFSQEQVPKKFKDSFLQLTISARKLQLTNQCRNLWRPTLKPSAGHKWPAGRVLDALALKGLLYVQYIVHNEYEVVVDIL